MSTSGKIVYFLCFVCLALTAAASIDRIGRSSIAPQLVAAVLLASLAGAPGLVQRRAWPVALVLLPLGAYLLARAQMPLPSHVHGLGGQVDFYAGQVRAGASAYQGQEFPLAFGNAPELKLLLSLVMYGGIWLAAFAALTMRRALPAIVVVLVFLGFGLTVDNTSRVVWLPLAFFLLAGCLLALSRSLRRARGPRRDVLAGAVTAVIAAVLALSLLGATSLAAGKPWRDWRTWGPVNYGSTRLFFDWMQNFPRLLDPEKDIPVMRVTSPAASYWRANALDFFNGTTWLSSELASDRLLSSGSAGSFTYAVPPREPQVPGDLVTERFSVQAIRSDYFFTGGTPTSLTLSREVAIYTNLADGLGTSQTFGPKLDYTLTALIPAITPSWLIDRGRAYPPDALPQAELPFPALAQLTGPDPASQWRAAMSGDSADREWLGLYRLDRTIVGQATDPYEVALRILTYLRSHYSYSLRPPDTRYRSPYAAFLFRTKVGYCQHFAGAMATLLRFNGIPARVAVGFTAGRRTGKDTFVVTTNDAHAWVEVYFPQIGWVPFDPTPGFTMPGPLSASAASGLPSAASSPSGAAATTSPLAAAGRQHSAGGAGGGRGGGGSSAPAHLLKSLGWIALLAMLLAAWPLGRAAIRRRGLHSGTLEARLGVSLKLLYGQLGDHGFGALRSQTLEEVSTLLKRELDLDTGGLAERVQAVVFGGRAATRHDLAELAEVRRELGRRLRRRNGWLRAALAQYRPPAAASS